MLSEVNLEEEIAQSSAFSPLCFSYNKVMLGKGLESLIPKKNVQNLPPANASQAPAKLQAEDSAWPHREPATPQNLNHAASVSGNLYQSKISPHLGIQKPKRDTESVFQIETEKIKPNPYQPRHEFNEEHLRELAQSIREFGILQPLVVSKIIKETDYGSDVEYQLIAGERRLMAAKLIGLPRVPAIVKRVPEHRLKLEMALIENIQRRDLNGLEEAKAYARLQDEFGLTQREIAQRVGKSREVVANTLRLLNLPSYVQEALSGGKINESQARMLLGLENAEEQKNIFNNLVEQKLTVRALRDQIQKTPKPEVRPDPQSEFWQKQVEEKLGAPVKLLKHGGKGRMVIQFYSEDELKGILGKLLGEEGMN